MGRERGVKKGEYKCCVKLFKRRQSTLLTQGISTLYHAHAAVQLPISVTSSVPEMSASHSPRGLLLLPPLATQGATSAFTVPLWKLEGIQLHNGTETGILGQKQATLFRVMPGRGRFLCHTKSRNHLDADPW